MVLPKNRRTAVPNLIRSGLSYDMTIFGPVMSLKFFIV